MFDVKHISNFVQVLVLPLELCFGMLGVGLADRYNNVVFSLVGFLFLPGILLFGKCILEYLKLNKIRSIVYYKFCNIKMHYPAMRYALIRVYPSRWKRTSICNHGGKKVRKICKICKDYYKEEYEY